MNQTPDRKLIAFQLSLYPVLRTGAEPVATFSGHGDEWQRYQSVRLQGFDGSQYVDLSPCWQRVLEEAPTEVQCEVLGRETIVKWSGTHQITEQYTLIGVFRYA